MRFLVYEGLDPGPLRAKFDKLCAAIERDDLRSADVKKLNVGPYYRAKLDDAARVLLQFVELHGERVCLALELLPRHEYERSRFLRGATIDDAKLPEAFEAPALQPTPVRWLHPTRPTFSLLDKPLSFDDAQEAVLRATPPLVLVGSAGSGKTALLVSLLRRQTGRIAYVTESPWLAESARALFVAHGFDAGETEAEFLSYRQLVDSVASPEGRPMAFRDFVPFFQRHRGRLGFTDAHACFEELRGVVTAAPEGPLSLEAYLALGVRQSLYDEPGRRALHALLPPLQTFLREQGLYEPNLVAAELLNRAEPRWDFVAVDEVQDLTPVQLALVLALKRPAAPFVLAGDGNQVVHPNFFSWSSLKSMFWRAQSFSEADQLAVLNVSYRNGEQVTATANRLLRVKHARFGSVDRESNQLMRPVSGVAGEVRGLRTDAKEVAQLGEATRRSTKVAVLVLREEHKADARARFRTPLVFTVLEAKGLEYETVILYRLVSSERQNFQEIARDVSIDDEAGTELAFRRAKDKADKSLDAYKFFVNALYVALTRAVMGAVFVEDDPSHPLLALLEVAFDGPAVAVAPATSTTEEWQREAHRLEQQGKLEQAAAIRADVLHERPVPWTILDEPALHALAAKALDPKGVSSKARQQLFEQAAMFLDGSVLHRLEALKFPHARDTAVLGRVIDRWIKPFAATKPREVLELVDRHGVDYRSPHNLTPLMLAAMARNVPLVEELLDRGANLHLRDHLGRQAVHWALREPPAALGALWERLAPPSFDVLLDGRSLQVGRESAEYLLFQLLLSRFSGLYRTSFGRWEGFTAAGLFEEGFFEALPEVVAPAYRRKRPYVNSVLARSEASSSYATSRRLWLRERMGHYVPNLQLSLKVATPGGGEAWRPLGEVMGLSWLEANLVGAAMGRLLPPRG